MPKIATQWKPASSGTTSATSGAILTQASDNLVTQASERLVVTASLVSGPLATEWDETAKAVTAWKPGDSGTTTTLNSGVIRTSQADDTRITQDGNTRVLNESIVTGKTATEWNET